MMTNFRQTRNYSAMSVFKVDGQDIVVAFFNGNYDGENIGFNMNIQNKTLYGQNRAEVDSEFADFQDMVMEDIG